MIFVKTPTLSSSRSLWQRKNEASVHRTAKEFAVNHKRVRELVSINNSTLKGQTRGMLGKCRCLCCGQPLSVDLDHRVSGAWGTTESVARADRQLLSVCNIMFLYQHLGASPEEGAYSQDRMSDPAYKPPLRFRLVLRLQNGGGTCGHYGACLYKWEISNSGRIFPPKGPEKIKEKIKDKKYLKKKHCLQHSYV